jgi:para-aminobenzoate synthetase component 2
MFLIIDNYDSFVYNLAHYIETLGEPVKVYRNDSISIDFIKSCNPTGIILSPGPKDPRDTGICEDIVRTFAGVIPILGVCLGHQTIAHVFGSQIIKGGRPMHGKVTPITHEGVGVFKALPSPMNVTRYHSLVVDPDTLSSDFTVTAWSNDNQIMAFRHNKWLLEGVQFHPEAVLTEHGHDMLQNFIQACKEVNS